MSPGMKQELRRKYLGRSAKLETLELRRMRLRGCEGSDQLQVGADNDSLCGDEVDLLVCLIEDPMPL